MRKGREDMGGVSSNEDYTPPVGPDSSSLPPAGNFRDIDPGLVPRVTEDRARDVGRIANKKD